MLPAVGRALLQQVLDVEGQDHAVQRAQRPGTAQHLQKVGPARSVHSRVRLLQRIAACGVDEYRFFAEPPVAVARAAHTLDRGLPHLAGQRKGQPRIEQGGGLARAGRADKQVPGKLVQVLPRFEPAALAGLARAVVQHLQGFGKALVQQRRLTVGRTRTVAQFTHHPGVGMLASPPVEQQDQQGQHHEAGQDGQPHGHAGDRVLTAPTHQRAYPPHQDRNRQQCVEQEGNGSQQVLQHILHLASCGWFSVISTRRLRARPAGVVLSVTGSLSL